MSLVSVTRREFAIHKRRLPLRTLDRFVAMHTQKWEYRARGRKLFAVRRDPAPLAWSARL